MPAAIRLLATIVRIYAQIRLNVTPSELRLRFGSAYANNRTGNGVLLLTGAQG